MSHAELEHGPFGFVESHEMREKLGCVVRVHDVRQRLALELTRLVSEHALGRGRDVGDAQVRLDHGDQVPGLVDQRTEAGRLHRVGLAHGQRQPHAGDQERHGGQGNGGPAEVAKAGEEQDGHADARAERGQRKPGDPVGPRLFDVGREDPDREGEKGEGDGPGRTVADIAESAHRLQQVETVADGIGDQRDTREGEEEPESTGEHEQAPDGQCKQQDVPQGIGQVRRGSQGAPTGDPDHGGHHEGRRHGGDSQACDQPVQRGRDQRALVPTSDQHAKAKKHKTKKPT